MVKRLVLGTDGKLHELGATGKYPHGKISKDDEGELIIGITADRQNNTVVINFGKSVDWIGLNKETALKMAETMIETANELPLS